jgi:PAS domain S-box-containing protein
VESSSPSPVPPKPPSHPQNAAHLPAPAKDILASLYQHLPVLVVHMTSDGVVLHCNPEVTRVTGYVESELVGKNFWGLLFPGRLFAQVPKFISAIHPVQALAKDVAMTLRTRDGHERTVAFSRFSHEGPASPGGSSDDKARSIVCIGNDLTDRLLDSDKPSQLNAEPASNLAPASSTVEGELVTPLAITPPLPTAGENAAAAVQQVHEFLTEMDARVIALVKAFSEGEMDSLATIAAGLRNGAHACGLLDFCSRAEHLRMAATSGAMAQVTTLVHEIVTLCRPAERSV